MTINKAQYARLHRLFFEGFTAMDLAEPLVSFDAGTDALAVRQFLLERDYDLAGVRRDGLVCGCVRREALITGHCGDYLVPFCDDSDLVPDNASLVDVVRSLAINRQCFVTVLGQPAAIITLDDMEKPPMRMFLFGLVTIGEMIMTDVLRARYADGAWQGLLSEARLAKARDLQAVRERCGQKVELIDCLQYGDKGWILSYDQLFRETLGFKSRSEARESLKEMESLRNNLAHTQAIVPSGWQRIVIACSRMESNLERLQASPVMAEPAALTSPYWQRLENLMRRREADWWEKLVDAIPELAPMNGTPQPVEHHAEGDVAEHTRMAVAACPAEADPDLLWVALLHDIGKPATTVHHADGRITAHDHARTGAAMADAILLRLKLPDQLRERIVWVVRNHTFHHSWNIRRDEDLTRKHRSFIADERFPLLLEFLRIDTLASSGGAQRMDVYDFYRRMRQEITTASLFVRA